MANKVIHKRSIQKGLLPSGTTLDYGEIAVNYNSGEPFLSIRTTESGKTDTNYAKFIDEGTIDAKIKNVENQNAFSKVAVSGQTTIEADSATDTLTFAAGSNISITTDASNDKITIAATGLSVSGHNHDDRYYTESEINALLDKKSDIGHTHDGVLKNIELFLASEATEEFFADIQNTDTAIKEWKESGERRNVLFKVVTNNVDLPIGIVNAEGTYTFEEAKNNLMTFVNFQNHMYYQLGILSFSEMGATSEQMGLPSGIEYVCGYEGHNPLTETISYGNDFFVDPQFKSLHISLSSPNIKRIINTTPSVQDITYENLVHFRDNGQLVAGMQYRITDYETTTTQANTQSAGHQFDVIVTADDHNTLNEVARAIHRQADTYFANSDVNAWQIWYCLDNDTNRFAWADATNGKGVIYRMIDEFGNDCPYDFKNIQFKHPHKTDDTNWYYTFTYVTNYSDATVNNPTLVCISNIILPYIVNNVRKLNNNVFTITAKCRMNTLKDHCYNNSFGENTAANYLDKQCYNNCFGDICQMNELGPNSHDITASTRFQRNIVGAGCNNLSFGIECKNNKIGSSSMDCVSGDYFQCNTIENIQQCTIGNEFKYNTIESGCLKNTFGDDFWGNIFGNSFQRNTLGSHYNGNQFFNRVADNILGDNFEYNVFYTNVYSLRTGNNFSMNTFGTRTRGLRLINEESEDTPIQFYNFVSGVGNGEHFIDIEVTRGNEYETKVAVNSKGRIITYCEADLIAVPLTLISFEMFGLGNYQAEEGMTWGEWVNSEYNTLGYKINADSNITSGTANLHYLNNSDYRILASDLIQSDGQYRMMHEGGSDD